MNTQDALPPDDVVLARAYLAAVAEPPAPSLTTFVARHGPVETAERVRAGEVPAEVADEVEARRGHVDGRRVLDSATESGVRIVCPEHPEWPHERFSCFAEATEMGVPAVAEPIALWCRGSASAARLLDRSVAIVGARAASAYGESVAAELAHGTASTGCTVVSGAAYGIDGAAHRGALAAGGPTVAFLACGADFDYPAGHSRLLRSISDSGLVISEYVPGTRPRKHRFLVRNRLIAASGRGTVVVEAGARSGASNTAATADALGRSVMAVPGPVTSVSSVGCHTMIRSGNAVLVTNADEVAEVINPMGMAPPVDTPVPERRTDGLDQCARRLHDVLGTSDGHSAEQLARDTGLPLRKVRAVLPALEMAGLVELREQGWARCRS